ncbi:MarR family transcriptional regulator [Pseudactinotalea sp. HY158]|nr:MarR family transcriptional regulator [Pseudactinotalea sp. HY158]
MHDPRVIDSRGRLIDVDGTDEEQVAGAVEVLNALFRWRRAEQRVSEASARYMRLSATDMRAVRYLIVAADAGTTVTARDIAEHLGISSASTTKLLDRMEAGGHIRRQPHPSDRRALAIVVTDATRVAAERTIGREHARRFRLAADLGPDERAAVIGFLDSLSRTAEDEWGEG